MKPDISELSRMVSEYARCDECIKFCEAGAKRKKWRGITLGEGPDAIYLWNRGDEAFRLVLNAMLRAVVDLRAKQDSLLASMGTRRPPQEEEAET